MNSITLINQNAANQTKLLAPQINQILGKSIERGKSFGLLVKTPEKVTGKTILSEEI